MHKKLRIAVGQLNFLVGDIQGNLQKIIASAEQARDQLKADLIIFPELALSGYPPEDLLLRTDFHEEIKAAIEYLKNTVFGIDIILGYPERVNDALYNAALFIANNKVLANYHKQQLPNYGVFDEQRYFKKGNESCIVDYKGLRLGIIICEDLWFPEPIANLVAAGAQCVICINASPFDVFKLREREKIMRTRINEHHIPIIYAHCIGGQDELVFDGRSIVMNEKGEITHFAPIFEEALFSIDLEYENKLTIIPGEIHPRLSDEARTYQALVTATRDYINKNHFPGALIGLSGGIDSALVLTIAVDAIGKDSVHAILMPSRYTAQYSIDDAKTLAENLGVHYSIISIETVFEAFLKTLQNEFVDTEVDNTEENIQARCRAIILMGLSNKFGKLVLTTGNKSEMAVGYATLYGDMAGGFAVLKDVYKTIVYNLANYRNQIQAVIPQRIIDRPPSAELRLEQTDQDTLPAYPILDDIIKRYVEQDWSIADIISIGYNEEIVKSIVMMIDKNEYKRRQAPPGVRITTRAFGRDRRYPITSGFGRNRK
jgi:NAD+ synthase (glutamine-hydrolysing)